MTDEKLMECNKTELLTMALAQGLPRLRKSLPTERLVAIVSGQVDPGPEDTAGSLESRRRLEEFIGKHIDRVRNQLPGCNGRCTSFPCTEIRHAMCFAPNKDFL
jgi:hypothetical protein